MALGNTLPVRTPYAWAMGFRFRIGEVDQTESLYVFRPIRWFPVWLQASLVVALYVATVLCTYHEFKTKGTSFGYAGPAAWLLFVPITEELIFRGFILTQFVRRVSNTAAIAGSSALFSLWHLRNIFWNDLGPVVGQMVYTGLFFGPVAAYLTLRFRTLWPAVILHYVNNLGYYI